MLADFKYITINSNAALVEKFILEAILIPRLKVIEWSKITKQTPGLKIGYPAQHIASLLTGVEGKRTAARGDDLADGSEVKGCNRLDQLDTCGNCGNKVLRSESTCSDCNSDDIQRKDDSKWLLTIKHEDELLLYTKTIDRIIFILLDYPNFERNDFDTLSIKAFEIWPKFNQTFCQLVSDYYNEIYLKHIEMDPKKTPAPKNFWPYSFQFYKCKPIKTYECLIKNINTSPVLTTLRFTDPRIDRSTIVPENVPTQILTMDELDLVFSCNGNALANLNPMANKFWSQMKPSDKSNRENKQALYSMLPTLPCDFIDCLNLRDTSKAAPHAKRYIRR